MNYNNNNQQNTVNNINQNFSQPSDKMQRIEQNYINDKKALAKGNDGVIETGGIKTTANDKVINEISDDLIEEIKKKKNDI